MPLIYHEGYSLGDSDGAGIYQLVKDTVGWTGKNLIPLPYEFGNQQTQGGITAKANADGSITFNGTVTASISFRLKGRSIHDNNYFLVKPGKYIFSCGNIENNFYWGIATTKNNSYSAIVDGLHTSTYELTITSDMSDEAVDGAIPLAIYANFRTLGDVYNNFTVYPMIRKADITDPTYESYHESVEVMYEEEIHGVNLADSSMANIGIAWNGNTNSDRARLVIPCSPNTEYIASINGTNAMSYIGYVTSPTIIPSQTSLIDFVSPASITTGANDRYIIIGFAKTGITQANVDALKFMLRKADIDDPTYRPYNEQAIQNQLNAQGVLGAKNLLENTASTTTVNGVTFTVNADKSVTVNGTATADATIKITPNSSLRSNLKEGISYILSGCPGGGSSSTYALQYSNNTNNVKYDTGSGVEFVDYDRGTYPNVSVYILIRSGVTASNLTFKPMIRLASDPDDTYQPYAMTNRELTENVSPIEITNNWLTLPTDITKGDQYTVFKIGKLIIVNIVLCRNAGFDGTEFAIPINSQYQPIKQINANAIFQPTQYITEGSVGYLYVADKLIIRNMQSTPVNFCKINIAYICK